MQVEFLFLERFFLHIRSCQKGYQSVDACEAALFSVTVSDFLCMVSTSLFEISVANLISFITKKCFLTIPNF